VFLDFPGRELTDGGTSPALSESSAGETNSGPALYESFGAAGDGTGPALFLS
jgi:hypothetical protein